MVLRVDVHLIGIAGKKGHKSAKVSTFRDYPSAIFTLLLQDIAVEAAFVLVIVFLSLTKFFLGDGRDVGKGIDLAVGMGKGHSDLLALVLKNEDVVNVAKRAQLLVTVGPHLHQIFYLDQGEVSQASLVAGGIKNYLTDTQRGLYLIETITGDGRGLRLPFEGGELILKDRNLVVLPWHLGGEGARQGGTERAVMLGRKEGPLLAVGSRDHPFTQSRIIA
jgi:hypothetical protein